MDRPLLEEREMGRMVAARRAGGGLPLQCDGGFVLRLLCPLPTAPRGPLVARPLNDNMSDTPTVRSGCFFVVASARRRLRSLLKLMLLGQPSSAAGLTRGVDFHEPSPNH